ncbi:N-acyl-aromatic-L-amino acid amidohydrolase (carboxylate-forming)-like [Acipenser ruthenus]|uniref:N-acyl-aromatic-L-amino acid amidohydrolase (carboxylate-forming)-like n=1 Tax=Acipenser ruthenus TaxID=7906 RepID=UPI0027422076|nr:N-acyl-aromatic-L-amino acid amidohydrolase (carboxylate-forming)-like [Acipenser ruthenus]
MSEARYCPISCLPMRRCFRVAAKTGVFTVPGRQLILKETTTRNLMERSTAFPSRPLSRVVVTSGTHGNELGGVCLVREWLRQGNTPFLHWRSFRAQTLLANPRATKQNRRYLETDLNRCFTAKILRSLSPLHSSAVF